MGKKRKPYSKKYPMLDNIHWVPVKISEEENEARVKRLAKLIIATVDGNQEKFDSEKIEESLEEKLDL